MTPPSDQNAIQLAERILSLLEQGRFSATYKFAVLLGLLDLCLELAERSGDPPDTVTTTQLAEKVIELYWPQTATFSADNHGFVLRQGGGAGEQAEIVARITVFRAALTMDPSAPLSRAKARSPRAWRKLVATVEWKLIEMPLLKLQRVGRFVDSFLYEIAWTESVRRSDLATEGFDNRIRLRPGVGESLVRLHSLLRPLIHRRWAQKVAELNTLEEARMERFLFGEERYSLEAVRGPLVELHQGRCFYCEERLRDGSGPLGVHIDHFIPWSRHAENAVENLVPAHARCNLQKRDFLAARPHLQRWRARMDEQESALAAVAREAIFEHAPGRVRNVAASIYRHLPGTAPLWVAGEKFEAAGAGLGALF